MVKVITHLALSGEPSSPVTIYYAFKQADTDAEDGTSASTGWETFSTLYFLVAFPLQNMANTNRTRWAFYRDRHQCLGVQRSACMSAAPDGISIRGETFFATRAFTSPLHYQK